MLNSADEKLTVTTSNLKIRRSLDAEGWVSACVLFGLNQLVCAAFGEFRDPRRTLQCTGRRRWPADLRGSGWGDPGAWGPSLYGETWRSSHSGWTCSHHPADQTTHIINTKCFQQSSYRHISCYLTICGVWITYFKHFIKPHGRQLHLMQGFTDCSRDTLTWGQTIASPCSSYKYLTNSTTATHTEFRHGWGSNPWCLVYKTNSLPHGHHGYNKQNHHWLSPITCYTGMYVCVQVHICNSINVCVCVCIYLGYTCVTLK